MPGTQEKQRGVTVQASYTLASGNRLTVHVDDQGEVTENYATRATKEDRDEAALFIPDALAEAGIRNRERGEEE